MKDEQNLMTCSQAVAALLDRVHPICDTECIPLEAASGRRCAVSLVSKNTLPVVRSAQADGIAVRFSDLCKGVSAVSDWRLGRDYVTADTGDDFDDAFDTVIQVEDLRFDSAGILCRIEPEEPVKSGQLISPCGAVLQQGEALVRAGETLHPLSLCLLACAGFTQVEVFRKPVVAYLPTGDELVAQGIPPKRGQNVQSNGVMVHSYLTQWGAQVRHNPIVPDSIEMLQDALHNAMATADLVLINGGSSKGSEDYNAALLQKYASFFQHGVRCIPGIPVALAMLGDKPVINLPGPPFAVFCALDWAVRPLIYRLSGQSMPEHPRQDVLLCSAVTKPTMHELYLRLHVFGTKGHYQARPLSWDTRFAQTFASCNAFLVAPIGSSGYRAGDMVQAQLLCNPAEIPLEDALCVKH